MTFDATNTYDSPQDASAPRPSLLRRPRFWIAAACCVLALIAVQVAYAIGLLQGQTFIYEKFATEQQTRMEAFLAEYPKEFGGLTVEKTSDGWASPWGTVKTQADYDFLNQRLNTMFGDKWAGRMMETVQVEGR